MPVYPVAQTHGVGVYGDGSDGDVTVTVSAALTRDMYYNNLTINAGVTLTTGGFRVFVRGVLHLVSTTSVIGRDSGVPSQNPPAALAAGTLGGAASGGAGLLVAGTAGESRTNSLSGNAGAGGAGVAGAGGAAGAASAPAATDGKARGLPQAVLGMLLGLNRTALNGGAGGGGGGGNAVQRGGHGSTGGGVVMVAARHIIGPGKFTARSGNAGGGQGNNTGGGGSGSGGLVIVVCDATDAQYTTDVTAGTPGAGTGTGAAGTQGASGTVIELIASVP